MANSNSFVDTHCHLDMIVSGDYSATKKISEEQFLLIEELLQKSSAENVNAFINIGTSLIGSQNSIEISARFRNVYSAIGIHPNSIEAQFSREYQEIEKLLKDRFDKKIVAIGEVGLDFYRSRSKSEQQRYAFEKFIELSLNYSLPLVIHTRSAIDETLEVIDHFRGENLTGVFHCFSETIDMAEEVLKRGFYIGIDGHVTYKRNQYLRDVARQIPNDKILLETDAPFLPPEPFRGKKNYPYMIPVFAKLVAELRSISVQELAKITTENAKRLFGIKL